MKRDWSRHTSAVEYGLSKLDESEGKPDACRRVSFEGKGYRTDRVVGLPRSSSSLNLWLGGRSCAEQAAHATVLPRPRPRPAACAAFHTCTCNALAVCYAKRFTYTPTVIILMTSARPSLPSATHALRTIERGTTRVRREGLAR